MAQPRLPHRQKSNRANREIKKPPAKPAAFFIRRLCFAQAGLKTQRHAVHAIAQARGPRAVVEDMAQMAAAAAAMHFGAVHVEAMIGRVSTALGSGFQKLGQPVWLSYLVSEEKLARSQPAQA